MICLPLTRSVYLWGPFGKCHKHHSVMQMHQHPYPPTSTNVCKFRFGLRHLLIKMANLLSTYFTLILCSLALTLVSSKFGVGKPGSSCAWQNCTVPLCEGRTVPPFCPWVVSFIFVPSKLTLAFSAKSVETAHLDFRLCF